MGILKSGIIVNLFSIYLELENLPQDFMGSVCVCEFCMNFQMLEKDCHFSAQNLAKSSPYFWLQYTQSKVRGRFRKILWPSQNIWTLTICAVLSASKQVPIEKSFHLFMSSFKTVYLATSSVQIYKTCLTQWSLKCQKCSGSKSNKNWQQLMLLIFNIQKDY